MAPAQGASTLLRTLPLEHMDLLWIWIYGRKHSRSGVSAGSAQKEHAEALVKRQEEDAHRRPRIDG